MATPESQDTLRILVEYMGKIIDDPEPPLLPQALADDLALQAWHDKMLTVRLAVSSIAAGDLSPEILTIGFLPDACKTLQANLRHLIWKVQQVEKGDYSHRIDFLGDFSKAFNNMVLQLENTILALHEKEEVLINLAKSLQEETKKHAQKRISTLRELQQSEREMRYQAHHDALTGLLNRRSFFDLAEKKLTSAMTIERPSAICLLDIDFFKKFNDTYGHIAGDSALKHMVECCSACLRLSDSMGRYGGEEFIFFFAEAGMRQAKTIAERIRTAIMRTPVTLSGHQPVPITASLGVCVLARKLEPAPKGAVLRAMIDQADKALYVAKNSGRNRVCIVPYEPVLREGASPILPSTNDT